MKNKKKQSSRNIDELDLDLSRESNPEEYPLWYMQLVSLKAKFVKSKIASILSELKKTNPAVYSKIRSGEFEVVGLTPRIEYIIESDVVGEGDVNWIHNFASATLVLWDKKLKVAVQANPYLRYNDSVANEIKGNPSTKLLGFTG